LNDERVRRLGVTARAGIIRVFLVCTLWVTPVGAAETPAKEPNDADHKDLTGDFIEAGDFPKSIKIPGSTFSFRFGGYIKLDMIKSFDPIGNEDFFQTNTIPIDGTPESAQWGV